MTSPAAPAPNPQTPGHRVLSTGALAAITQLKALEAALLDKADEIAEDGALDADRRWLALARTKLEEGFMAIIRAVAKPEPMPIAEAVRILGDDD